MEKVMAAVNGKERLDSECTQRRIDATQQINITRRRWWMPSYLRIGRKQTARWISANTDVQSVSPTTFRAL